MERGTCSNEGCNNLQGKNHKSKVTGKWSYKKLCCNCTKRKYGLKFGRKQYQQHKKDRCEFCGFIAVHHCQLDVDHIDGNNKNNDVSNLQTLCSNCHRLKTLMNREGSYKRMGSN